MLRGYAFEVGGVQKTSSGVSCVTSPRRTQGTSFMYSWLSAVTMAAWTDPLSVPRKSTGKNPPLSWMRQVSRGTPSAKSKAQIISERETFSLPLHHRSLLPPPHSSFKSSRPCIQLSTMSINSRSSPRQRAHHPILLRLHRFRRSATGVTTKIEKEHADTSGTEAVVGTGTRGHTIPHKEVESETVVR